MYEVTNKFKKYMCTLSYSILENASPKLDLFSHILCVNNKMLYIKCVFIGNL